MDFVSLCKDAECPTGAASTAQSFGQIHTWVLEYLCRPNALLGRPGPVCPFAGPAYQNGTIWLATAVAEVNNEAQVISVMNEALDFFLSKSTDDPIVDANHAVLVAFPGLDDHNGFAIVETCQKLLKPRFVGMGLMVGQFYQTCSEPGLRNPDFQPLKSPIPLLAIRYMVKSDIAFLRNTPEFREAYNLRFATVFS